MSEAIDASAPPTDDVGLVQIRNERDTVKVLTTGQDRDEMLANASAAAVAFFGVEVDIEIGALADVVASDTPFLYEGVVLATAYREPSVRLDDPYDEPF